MDTKANTSTTVSEVRKTVDIKETIVRIGIILLFAAFLISILVINLKYIQPPKPNPNTDLGRLIWESLISIPSGAVFFIDLLASFLLMHYAKNLKKVRILFMSVLFFVITVFDNIAINYPLQQAWIALVNLLALFFCVIIVLLQKPEKVYISKPVPQKVSSIDDEITKVLANTYHKKIIAVQLYRVDTSKAISENGIEKIRFDVSHVGNDFVRAGYDINSISRISYELDRDIVDAFPSVLGLYNRLRENGDDTDKNTILNFLNDKITMLEARLQSIDALPRPITKDDCCIARALTILLSFRYILDPPPDARETQNDNIGEISLHDGDLKLTPETEAQLFTRYRTGILGAALLDKDLRHIFHYQKDGTKNGRKYSATQLICDTKKEGAFFSSQTMYICLFTIEESDKTYIPGYMFNIISKREEEITYVLNKIKEGGERSA